MTRRRNPLSLQKLLPSVIDELGISERLREARIEEAWRTLAGPQIARVTGRVRVLGDRLLVRVKSAPWRQELHMQRQQWLEQLKRTPGAETLKEIVFR